MTIEIAQDWFDNNISEQQGFTLDSETEVYTKVILEADLNFEFSTDTDGEFPKKENKTEKYRNILINLDVQISFSATRCQLHQLDSLSMTLLQLG